MPNAPLVSGLTASGRSFSISKARVFEATTAEGTAAVLVRPQRWRSSWPVLLSALKHTGFETTLRKDAKGSPLLCIVASHPEQTADDLTSSVITGLQRPVRQQRHKFFVDLGWIDSPAKSSRLGSKKMFIGILGGLALTTVLISAWQFQTMGSDGLLASPGRVSAPSSTAAKSALPINETEIIRSFISTGAAKTSPDFDTDVLFDSLISQGSQVDVLRKTVIGGLAEVSFQVDSSRQVFDARFELDGQHWQLMWLKARS